MSRAPAPLLGGIGRVIADVELHAAVPEGSEERFSGYGIWSLPFASQRSVWHASPLSSHTFTQRSCDTDASARPSALIASAVTDAACG